MIERFGVDTGALVQPFLVQHRAANSVLLGLAEGTQSREWAGWAVRVEGELALVAMKMRTRPFLLSHFGVEGSDAQKAVCRELAKAVVDELSVEELEGVNAMRDVADAFVAALGELWSGLSTTVRMEMAPYELDASAVVKEEREDVRLRAAREDDLAFLRTSLTGFMRDVWGERYDVDEAQVESMAARFATGHGDDEWHYVLEQRGEDGQWRSASIAACMRTSADTRRVRLLYTPPAFRRSGLGKAIVRSMLTDLLARSSATITLFADVAQASVNRLYVSCGFRPVGTSIIYNLAVDA